MKEFFKKRSVLFLIAIMALAAFFRLYQIAVIPPGLYPDEAMNGNNALQALHTGEYKIFYPENNGREGLFINIQSLSIRIFGNEPWALRLVSALFGILTVLGVYFLTKELFKTCLPAGRNESIALFASFFMATSFWHIMFSRIGFRAIMAPFFLVWAFWMLWKIINNQKNKIIISFIAGILFGLGFHSYIAYRAAPLLLIPPFLILLKNKNYKPILIFIAGAFIAVLPLLIFFANNPQDFLGRTSQVSIFSSPSPAGELAKNIAKTIGMFFWQGDLNWRHNFAGAPQLWYPVSILFLIGIIISVKKIFSKQDKLLTTGYWLLAAWFIIMLLPVVISNEGIPHALRAIIVIPPVMIFAALGLDWLVGKIRKWLDSQISKYPESEKQILRIKKEFTGLVFVFLITVASFALIQYFFRWSINPNVYYAFSGNYAEIGRYLDTAPQDIKKYVIINADGAEINGIPMPSQTVMFLTDTFLPTAQKEKNIYYVVRKEIDGFIEKTKEEKGGLEIIMLENEPALRQKLSKSIPGLSTYQNSGVLIQGK